MRALSIRQPWAKLILRGEKTIEARPMRTNKRGQRVYIYAGLQRIEPEEEARLAAEFGLDVGAPPDFIQPGGKRERPTEHVMHVLGSDRDQVGPYSCPTARRQQWGECRRSSCPHTLSG